MSPISWFATQAYLFICVHMVQISDRLSSCRPASRKQSANGYPWTPGTAAHIVDNSIQSRTLVWTNLPMYETAHRYGTCPNDRSWLRVSHGTPKLPHFEGCVQLNFNST